MMSNTNMTREIAVAVLPGQLATTNSARLLVAATLRRAGARRPDTLVLHGGPASNATPAAVSALVASAGSAGVTRLVAVNVTDRLDRTLGAITRDADLAYERREVSEDALLRA
ncbi:hypothetical protein [Occultella gossypii]|uniref:Uncharacterized protein n=1 Tax=Occultella gossypii TaxID=2800820 RepID=A0ABS7S5G0_9MICO|nr:hypothetical protein [Occultella gossypii]MBZ2195342.1 hypothetical protein [Occultella gossypii]